MLIVTGLVLIFAALSFQMMGAEAANSPPEFADEIFSPVSLGMAPDGRLFVLTDSGVALVIKDDQRLRTPLSDIKNKVDDVSDRGLLSMAFDNNFAVNGFIYVVYTFDTNGVDDGVGRNRLVRFSVNGDTASNEVLLFDDFPDADVVFHYGGAVEMGTDGKLYVLARSPTSASRPTSRSLLNRTMCL
ncbi:MAG: glucose/arabinose dehydrogenase [Verrucomicrobiales bacterium]